MTLKFRHVAFYLHRYIGLLVGLILVIVGLTGSLLVFTHELDQIVIEQRFGQVIPQEQPLPLSAIADKIKTAYSDRADFKLAQFDLHPHAKAYRIRLRNSQDKDLEVFVNPYTGNILGDRIFNTFVPMHYGTFWGLPSRILYVLVGLSPTILFLTSLVMYRYRRHPKVV